MPGSGTAGRGGTGSGSGRASDRIGANGPLLMRMPPAPRAGCRNGASPGSIGGDPSSGGGPELPTVPDTGVEPPRGSASDRAASCSNVGPPPATTRPRMPNTLPCVPAPPLPAARSRVRRPRLPHTVGTIRQCSSSQWTMPRSRASAGQFSRVVVRQNCRLPKCMSRNSGAYSWRPTVRSRRISTISSKSRAAMRRCRRRRTGAGMSAQCATAATMSPV